MAILHSTSVEQAYILFADLPENENILDTFQLMDYLGVHLFQSPPLKQVFIFAC